MFAHVLLKLLPVGVNITPSTSLSQVPGLISSAVISASAATPLIQRHLKHYN